MRAARGAVPVLVALLAGCAGAVSTVRPGGTSLSADEYNDLGVAYYERGEHRRAAQAFEQALARRPGFTRALINLGDARLALGDVDGAIVAYETARALVPHDHAVANNLAWALLQHPTRWSEAELLIRRALATDPEPRSYFLDTLGVALLKKGDAAAALCAFRAALGLATLTDAGTRVLVLEHAADAHGRLGDHPAAARCRALASEAARGSVGARDPSC